MSQATYNSTKNPPYPTLLRPGVPGYAFGSKNPNIPVCRMQVTKVALTSNVATVTVQVLEGNIPGVGDLISITGTSTASGAFNVTAVATSTVSISPLTGGAGTITFALTHADVGATADNGQATCDVPEVPYLATGATKSAAFAIQAAKGQGRGISWAYTCPSQPGSISIQLEGAVNDNDAEYTLIGSAQTTTSGYNEVIATAPENCNFVRLNLTTFSAGTNPSIIGKISLS
jgi:hypothetical protein